MSAPSSGLRLAFSDQRPSSRCVNPRRGGGLALVGSSAVVWPALSSPEASSSPALSACLLGPLLGGGRTAWVQVRSWSKVMLMA